jgi:hypothetical protein
MSNGTAIDYSNPVVIRNLGIEALTKELGPVGMTCFIRQFDKGEGDYTKERHQWIDDLTTEDIRRGIKEMKDRR